MAKRKLEWVIGAFCLMGVAVSSVTGSFALQMEAVSRIGSEAIGDRTANAIKSIEDAAHQAVTVLMAAEALGVDDETLKLAEMDAELVVLEAVLAGQADVRGMAVNTVSTLETFGAHPELIESALALWADNSLRVEEAADAAYDAIDDATPASSDSVRKAMASFEIGLPSEMVADAQRLFEGMSGEMEADLRLAADAGSRELRSLKMTSPRKSVLRGAFRTLKRECTRTSKTMLKTLRDQHRAIDRTMRDAGATRADRTAVRGAYVMAMQAVRDAAEDAQWDLKAAR